MKLTRFMIVISCITLNFNPLQHFEFFIELETNFNVS
jgi:hypothetical protein